MAIHHPPVHPNTDLLSGLPEHLTARLFADAVPVAASAGEVLFIAGEPGDGCYRVEQGLVKVGMVSPTGSERILAILGPGAIFGELAVLDGRPRSATVTMIRDAQLSFVSRQAFDAFADRHPEFYKHLVPLLVARLREADALVAAGSFLSLPGRVARCLLDLVAAFGENVGDGRIVIRHKIGQSDLAAMAGIARESMSRIINDFTRRKVISRLSGYYCVEDKTKLEQELNP